MKKLKVIRIEDESIVFDNGVILSSAHEQDCCEHHWLSFKDLNMSDFDGLEFDLSNDDFFKRVPGYGIELMPIHGHPVRVAGYGSNNGYYSSELSLVISNAGSHNRTYGITECQEESTE